MAIAGGSALQRAVTGAFQLPIPVQFNAPANVAVVFEILQVVLDTPNPAFSIPTVTPGTGVNVTNNAITELHQGRVPPGAPTTGGLQDPTLIVHRHTQTQFYSDATGVVMPTGFFERTYTIDLTDQDGNGVIIPSQNLWLIFSEVSGAALDYLNTVAAFRVLYRYNAVPLSEYIQMVTSIE